MPNPTVYIGADEVFFTRRRYGRQTFTWVHLVTGLDPVTLGDPWPCITPKRSEIAAAIKAYRANCATSTQEVDRG